MKIKGTRREKKRERAKKKRVKHGYGKSAEQHIGVSKQRLKYVKSKVKIKVEK